jgi:hypothetical protein
MYAYIGNKVAKYGILIPKECSVSLERVVAGKVGKAVFCLDEASR